MWATMQLWKCQWNNWSLSPIVDRNGHTKITWHDSATVQVKICFWSLVRHLGIMLKSHPKLASVDTTVFWLRSLRGGNWHWGNTKSHLRRTESHRFGSRTSWFVRHDGSASNKRKSEDYSYPHYWMERLYRLGISESSVGRRHDWLPGKTSSLGYNPSENRRISFNREVNVNETHRKQPLTEKNCSFRASRQAMPFQHHCSSRKTSSRI